jgi:hypothetical protein
MPSSVDGDDLGRALLGFGRVLPTINEAMRLKFMSCATEGPAHSARTAVTESSGRIM